MGTPSAHLPPSLSTESIQALCRSVQLPLPDDVVPVSVAAEYHSIYFLSFSAESARQIRPALQPGSISPDGTATLVLRVSGRHLPGIKTRNEIGVMSWVRQNTNIPLPTVIRHDDSEENPIGHEFTLLEKIPGVSVDKIYDTLTEGQKQRLVEQLADYVIQLHGKPWNSCVGGLVAVNGTEEVQPGPPVEETFWQKPDIAEHWPGETVDSLNPVTEGAFQSYTAYIAGSIHCYIHAIKTHDSLAPFRDLIPRLSAFAEVIRTPKHASLDDAVYILAHKDMHFGNIMCDPSKGEEIPITAVLDWEFSGIVPANRWNPARAFLWSTKRDDDSKADQEKLENFLRKIVQEKAPHILKEMEPSPEQEAMQAVQSYVRAIVEVSPRGQCSDRVSSWKAVVEKNFEFFGV
ncbi:hypothetical protein B0T16DRAFT_326788 [Cercophora newfieldiana]|uniref:Aminoglycoside phosphotransferase domain-containing protein n=1 Tax=Cercophora newfieldiana TaxID=92897 RepID=A0AA39YEA4_9PEZI|nr:hypothetical protein B0T16DRAFT_326788 [Cercophora newfieldiana]